MKKFLLLIPFICLFAFLKKPTPLPFTGTRYIIHPGGDGGKIITGGYNPGDTLALCASDTWTYFFVVLNGTATNNIVFMSSSEDTAVRLSLGFNVQNSAYLKITGRRLNDTDTSSYLTSSRNFGIIIQNNNAAPAISISEKSRCIEVEMVEGYKCFYGIWSKNEVSCDTTLNWNGYAVNNFVMDSMNFHHNYFHNIAQDVIYDGSTGQLPADRPITCGGVTKNYVPTALGNHRIHHNLIDSANRTGIQIGGARYGYQQIYKNIIQNTGYEYVQNQGTGISIGGMSQNCWVFGNVIKNTFLYGIADFGARWTNVIDSNYVDSSGYIYINPSINVDSLATAKGLAWRSGNVLYNGGAVGSHPSNIYSTVKQTYPSSMKTTFLTRNLLGQNATTQDSLGCINFSNDADSYKQNWTKNNIVCDNTKIVGGGAVTILRFMYNSIPWPVYSTDCNYQPNDGILYAKIIEFNLQKINQSVALDWKITDARKVDVERSKDALYFNRIGSGINQYFDAFPPYGKLFYRLKAFDNDDNISYSNIRSVTINGKNQKIAIYNSLGQLIRYADSENLQLAKNELTENYLYLFRYGNFTEKFLKW